MQEQQLIKQMLVLSEKKLEMLLKLKELSVKQNKAFRDKALDDVEKILDQKDEAIQFIQKLDDGFLSHSEKLKGILKIESLEALSKTNLEGRKELKELIGKITGAVASIIQFEEDSFEQASGLKSELGEKIKGIHAGKRMTTAYTVKPTSNPSYFFDKKK